MKKSILLLLFIVTASQVSWGQYTVEDNQLAATLANRLVGEGVVVTNPVMNCPSIANGSFTGTGNLGIDSGIVLTSGRAKTSGTNSGVDGPFTTWGAVSTSNQAPGDNQLNGILPGITTNDACVLEFDFLPLGDSVKFNYVFASSEYGDFSCSNFNDVFGFFISGPGFATPQNLAVVPSTTIPVCVNSTTGLAGPTPAAPCTSLGAGSPFAQYYVPNNTGQFITYGGFTTQFTAQAAVTPCETYHLKLAIADGGDYMFDSGVFIEAGSLESVPLNLEAFGAEGLGENAKKLVRACPPGKYKISRVEGASNANELSVPIQFGGTAVNGVDYQLLSSPVTIPAGEDFVIVPIQALSTPVPTGPKTLILNILNPYECATSTVVATDTLIIYDSLSVDILENDTVICLGKSFVLNAETDVVNPVFGWSPTSSILGDPTTSTVVVSPTETTTYTVSVSIENFDCPAATSSVTIAVDTPPVLELGDDRKICLGKSLQLFPTVTPPPTSDFSYSWTPAASVDNPNILNPTVAPTETTVYQLTLNTGPSGCIISDSMTVDIIPDTIQLFNSDTTVCQGAQFQLNASGHFEYLYQWTPQDGVLNPNNMSTEMIANNSGVVTITASREGCDDVVRSFNLVVEPNPLVNVGPDRSICTYDTVQLFADVQPTSFNDYTYLWTPGSKLSDSTINDPVFKAYNSEEIILEVKTPAGCIGKDTIDIEVNTSNFIEVNPTDTGFCPNGSVQLMATGSDNYKWSPSEGLSNDTIANPVAAPTVSTNYQLTSVSPKGCIDTQFVFVDVYSEAIISMPDSVEVWPGETYEVDLNTNAHYFSWYPPEGLSDTEIGNTVASPDVRTRYYLTATTEHGCTTRDSIDIVVNLESIIDAPNAFVPGNKFVKNGRFKPVKRGSVELQSFEIFNRWGQIVYSSSDIEEGWDGTMNDMPQPAGVYVYQIKAKLNTGRVVMLQGNVTLIR